MVWWQRAIEIYIPLCKWIDLMTSNLQVRIITEHSKTYRSYAKQFEDIFLIQIISKFFFVRFSTTHNLYAPASSSNQCNHMRLFIYFWFSCNFNIFSNYFLFMRAFQWWNNVFFNITSIAKITSTTTTTTVLATKINRNRSLLRIRLFLPIGW